MKSVKQKSQFTIWRNVGFMFNRAWRYGKSFLFLNLVLVFVNASISMLQLFIAPQILEKVEFLRPVAEMLQTILFFSLSLFILNTLKNYLNNVIVASRNNIRYSLKNDMISKACTTSYPNVRDPKLIKMQENAISQTASSKHALVKFWFTTNKFVTDVLCFAIYLFLLSNLSMWLTCVVIITSVISFVVTAKLKQWGYKHREERASHLRKFMYISDKSESIVLAKDIRIFGLGAWLQEVQDKAISAYEAFANRREAVYRIASIVDTLLTLLRNAIAYIYLIYAAFVHNMSASEFLLYFSAISDFAARVTGLISCLADFYEESLDISVVQEYLNLPEPFRFHGGIQIPKSKDYTITIEDVSFSYPGVQKPIFENFNLTIKPKEKLAIVGLNGAGKTTLIKLIAGFQDPDKGRVLLNGEDIRSFNRQEYYELFSAIFQDYTLLDATLQENISLDRNNTDSAEIWECITKAGLYDVVNALPNGLNTHIGKDVFPDGVFFSGGQTQRLILARALYKDGAILLLDEPTSALDPIAESEIYNKYNEMTMGKTAVFISHRLASTRFCDRIIFLSDGAVAEEGTHEQLMKKCGKYAELFDIQSRYYQEGSNETYEKI